SYVRSQAIPDRKASLQENLYSFESRNYNFLDCERFSSPKQFGIAMAMAVLKSCFNLEKFSTLKDDLIAISEKNILKWLKKRDESSCKALMKDIEKPFDLETEISNFKLMVKKEAKVKLDDSCLSKHPPAQNIMFHRKAVNAIFSPVFDEFKNRVLYCLNSNIVFFTEMTNDHFSQILRRLLGDQDVYNVGEIDFSKFDKSQDIFVKEYERTLYEAFGIDSELLNVWMQGEYSAKATTLDGSLSFSVDNQRRSGGSNTWIGNSLVTLGIIALYYDVSKFRLLAISGDDSLIYSDNKIANFATEICLESGFETKFMSPSVPYFCSKFVVQTGTNTVFVPDPYKLMVKLGASNKFVTNEGLFEVYTSFRDLTKDYGNQIVLERLKHLVEKKYNFESGTTLPALQALHCLRSNFMSFARLFPRISGWWMVDPRNLKFFVKLPGIIIERVNEERDSRYFVSLLDSAEATVVSQD
ncbi:RdRp, partial [Strawberry chlorotic fleck-associated virus]